MRMFLFGIIYVLLVFFGTLTCANAVQYTMLDLGALEGGSSYAACIDDNGVVFGRLETGFGLPLRVFRWDVSTGMRDLELAPGIDIYVTDSNASGQLVGTVREYADCAFVWDSANGLRYIGAPGLSGATGINNSGKVVGVADYDGQYDAFLWDGIAGAQRLTVFGGPGSSASAINDNDQIAGTAHTTGNGQHAFMWQNNSITDLGTLGGRSSSARDINNNGQIVGWADTEDATRAFLWDKVRGMQDLGSLGGATSYAASINDIGTIVGTAYTMGGDRHAFVWDPLDGIQDLGTLWGTSEAVDVNSSGMIVGCSQLADGSVHAVLWNPVPEPSSLIVVSLAIGCAAIRRKVIY